MNIPKRHHFVPQFFMKPWFLEGNPKCENTKEKKIFYPSSPSQLGLKKHLYKFGDLEIESQFITPYIDNPLHESVIKVTDPKNKWDMLPYKVKEDFFKFLLLLDARQPASIESMKKVYKGMMNDFDFSKLPDKHLLKEFLNNDMCAFICIAIHELELHDFDQTKNKEFKLMLNYIKVYLNKLEDNGSLFPNFLSKLLGSDNMCKEIVSKENVFITSISPVRRMGAYDSKFLTVLSLSPNKCIIFSNSSKMIDAITNHDKDQVIKNINELNTKELSDFMPIPEIIIYPEVK
ncbi:DUF4238 domain-containing protein [Psychrobacter pygoscelis]|uniref:DUF4238 domain-containing protein n=1 Tax=Psychrobacter pygoscelis TaxID=2488563 RepID=UPI00103F590B|nr:DUF4238 domain-containing protein [Psychrobacter pygoscelis]